MKSPCLRAAMLLLAFVTTLTAQATKFITDVMLIGARTEGQIELLKTKYQNQGWTVIDNDLNAGCGSNSDYIYLLYKSEENTDGLNHGYITDFCISDATGTVADDLDYGDHTYYLVPFDGDDPQTIGMSTVGGDFKASKGDLNSGTNGVSTHLYFTREQFTDNRTVSAIAFDDTKNESVVWTSNGQAADLNKGCGQGTPYIYMHVDTAASAFPGYIKDVMLIGGTNAEVSTLKTTLTAQGWTVIDKDLNAGCGSSSDYIYLLYKSENSTDGYNHDYITDFYISNATGTPPDDLTSGGSTYLLVPFDGGDHFKEKMGDLNSNASGDDIHLYYTKKPYIDGHTVISVRFNNIKTYALGVNGGTEGYDLNKNAGGDDIYMHFTTGTTKNSPEPVGLTLSSCTDQEATLMWEAPIISNIKGYTYQYKEASASSWSTAVNTTATSVTISGLSPITSYSFRVKTRYGNNSESDYEVIQFTTKSILPAELKLGYCSDQEAVLGWEAPDLDNLTGYTYQLKAASAADWSAAVNTSSTAVDLTGLSPETSYSFRVKACYGNRESAYVVTDFTTARWPLPYTCGFENGMEGWKTVNLSSSSGIGDEYTYSGDHSFCFFDLKLNQTQYLISPRFSGLEALAVSFYYIGILDYPLQVGYSTTTNDPSAFTWIETITALEDEWDDYYHVFPEGTKYVAISYTCISNSYNYSVYLEDFSFSQATEYARPIGLAGRDMTDQSATLTWKAPQTNQSVKGYFYQYKKNSDNVWSDWAKVNTTSVTVNNMSANTNYQFRVKALYEGYKVSAYQTGQFLTEASMVSLPCTEGFENGMGGFRMANADSHTRILSDKWVRTGNYSFVFYSRDNSEDPQYLISPLFDGSSDMIVSFWYTNRLGDSRFQVGYSTETNHLEDFIWVDDIQIDDYWWKQYTATFPAGTKYIAIKRMIGKRLYLDDFCFEAYSAYAKPTGLAVSNLTDRSAMLTWTVPDDAMGYAYEYKKATETEWSATATVNSVSVTLGNLADNTTYEFRLRVLYSGNNASNNVYFKFLTEAQAVSLPHYQDFEDNMGGWRIVDKYDAGINTITPHTGDYGFCFLTGSDAHTQYLMSPQISSSSPINVSFYYNNITIEEPDRYLCYIADFYVGYSTTSKDPEEFEWSELIQSASPEWKLYDAVFPAETKYVAIKWIKSNPLILDDFRFEGPCCTLSSADNWNKWALAIAKGIPTTGMEFTLAADIAVSTMMGTENNPFSGTFNGQSHMLTLNIDKTADGVAPFSNISGATIKNLKTAGTVKVRGQYGSGLVGYVRGGTNLIENCVVGANVAMKEAYGGGIVGHLDSSATTTIDGCVFSGAISPLEILGNLYAATLVGFAGNGTTLTLKDCLDAGTSTKPVGRGDPVVTLSNNYYTTDKVFETGQNYWPDYYAGHASSTTTLPANIGGLKQEYGFVTAYANGLEYDGKYYMKPTIITLADGDNNSSTLSNQDGYFASVTLQGRKLYKDGNWNTICLPFSLTAAQLSNSPLAGADIRTLDSASFADGMLTLNFKAVSPSTEQEVVIAPGVPYIIRWTPADDYVNDNAHNIVNPTFKGVTISKDLAPTTIDNVITFMGTYDPVSFSSDDATKLFLGAANQLYYPLSGAHINACRAYFQLADGITASPNPSQGGEHIRAFVLNFGDESTGVTTLLANQTGDGGEAWYTLDGRKLNGKPSQRGIYINNGVKVVVK